MAETNCTACRPGETRASMAERQGSFQVRQRVRLIGQARRDFAEHAGQDLFIYQVTAMSGGDVYKLSQLNPPDQCALLRGLFDSEDIVAAPTGGC